MWIELLEGRVEPGWVDYNGHMNVAYYHMAFDRATDRLLERIGLGEDYAKSGLGTMFALEDHLRYRRELRQGEPFRIDAQLLDHDEKRVHYWQRMIKLETGELAATCEHLSIYVDLRTRRAALFPEAVRARIEEIYQAQRDLPRPEDAGRPVGIRRR